MRALLVLHKTKFPKVHDLLRLLRLCAKFEPGLEAHRDAFAFLSPYTVHFEKPGKEAEARRAVETIKNIRKVLRACFPPELLEPSDNGENCE